MSVRSRKRKDVFMATKTAGGRTQEVDAAALLHSLELHQAELEVQNAELREANEQLRTSNVALGIACERFRRLYELAPTPYVTVDARGVIADLNRAAEVILDTPRERLIGAAIDLFVDDAARGMFRMFLEQVFVDGHGRCGDMVLFHTGTARVDVFIDGVILREEACDPPCCVLALVDITARKLAETARRQAQDEMLAIVSHDLRAPLSAIGLASQTLEGGTDDDLHRRCVGTIDRATKRCERLIRDLLGVVHLESGHLSLQLADVDVAALVHQVCVDHEAAVVAARSTLSLVVGDGPHDIVGDRDRLHQVMSNLIGNALTHARRAAIEIGVVGGDEHVAISVTDHGPGIPSDELPFVFERYRQGAHHHGGAGLGLAIVKGLVLSHHGTVSVTSEIGRGTRFDIALPRRRSS